MSDKADELLSCQFCMEDFQEDGEFIPRILPCSHTLCSQFLGVVVKKGDGDVGKPRYVKKEALEFFHT